MTDTSNRGSWPAEETAEAVAAGATPFADVPTDERGFPTEEALRQALKAVVDPEIGINIVDLGLVYDIDVSDDGVAHVRMTLTTMGCPLTELLHQQCALVLTRLPGITDVDVEFVFSPPWTTDMISEEAKDELRAMGFAV
ncbi:MAG TPA: metal-sulfur cluster assembly factor [Egibacteraceae bacterium]